MPHLNYYRLLVGSLLSLAFLGCDGSRDLAKAECLESDIVESTQPTKIPTLMSYNLLNDPITGDLPKDIQRVLQGTVDELLVRTPAVVLL